jgi:hypothetical protein
MIHAHLPGEVQRVSDLYPLTEQISVGPTAMEFLFNGHGDFSRDLMKKHWLKASGEVCFVPIPAGRL